VLTAFPRPLTGYKAAALRQGGEDRVESEGRRGGERIKEEKKKEGEERDR